MADQYEFSADEERAMRQKARAGRADPALLAQVAPEFAPAAAQDAREVAAYKVGRRRRSAVPTPKPDPRKSSTMGPLGPEGDEYR